MVKSVVMKDVTSVLDAEQTNYRVSIDYTKDQLPENNSSENGKVKVVLPDYPTATALKATASDNNVNLTWTAPNLTDRKPKATTESFEQYDTFIIDGVGGWTMYDGDKQKTIQITLNTMFGPLKYDHAGEPMAFQVFNPSAVSLNPLYFSAHSGKQVAAAFSVGRFTPNDDWLISPEVDGAQAITFWAFSANASYYGTKEQIEVLYSTED